MRRNPLKHLLPLTLLFCLTISFSISPYDLADPDSLFFEWNGIDIHYKVEGYSDKVMLLFHGFGSSTFTWEFIKDDLIADFTLIAFDRPAFGLTERIVSIDKAGYNYYNFYNQSLIANELLSAIDMVPSELILMGHSAGTPIVIDYYLNHPTDVKGLILISPALVHKLSENPFAKTFSNPLIRGTVSLFRNLLARTLEGGLDESWYDVTKITDEIRTQYKKFIQIDDWEKALIELALNQGDYNMLKPLAEISIPVLILFGTHDNIVPHEDVQLAVKDNPNATVVFIDQTGHVPHEESPEKVLEQIKRWLLDIDFYNKDSRIN